MPDPRTEPPEKFPGGPDALADEARYGEIPDGPMGVDLPPDKNPETALDDGTLNRVTEPDDKSQEPDESDDQAQRDEEPETPV